MNNSLKNTHIPRATIQRLTVYLQVLESMKKSNISITSSEPLAQACDVNASQVRKDLAYFGEFGVRGVGYYVEYLLNAIRESLHANREWRAALIGVGNLGRALLNHQEFRRRGINIVGAFDCDQFKIGEPGYGLEIYLTKTLKEKVPYLNIELGIITTPPERIQRAADQLIEAGVKGILNFTPARIIVPNNVFVEYVDFFNQIYNLTFNISTKL